MFPLDEAFIRSKIPLFEDFWNRQLGPASFGFKYPAFGYTVDVRTNDEAVLDAARLSAPRYSVAEPLLEEPMIALNIFVADSRETRALPQDLPALIQTFAVENWMLEAATPWLQAVGDLERRAAFAFISPALAREPRMVSRYLLDRFTNNMALREGLGQLHATTLVKGGTVLALIAPHGTGKSTTAFQLLNVGYQLLGDGLLFIRFRGERMELMGYPVGEGKLTEEMQSLLPEWRGAGAEITVHNVRKSVVNLRALAPEKIVQHAIYPTRVLIFLAERNSAGLTHVEPMDSSAAFQQVLPETIHLDESDAMIASLDAVRRLFEKARCYRLTLGIDPDALVRTIDNLV